MKLSENQVFRCYRRPTSATATSKIDAAPFYVGRIGSCPTIDAVSCRREVSNVAADAGRPPTVGGSWFSDDGGSTTNGRRAPTIQTWPQQRRERGDDALEIAATERGDAGKRLSSSSSSSYLGVGESCFVGADVARQVSMFAYRKPVAYSSAIADHREQPPPYNALMRQRAGIPTTPSPPPPPLSVPAEFASPSQNFRSYYFPSEQLPVTIDRSLECCGVAARDIDRHASSSSSGGQLPATTTTTTTAAFCGDRLFPPDDVDVGGCAGRQQRRRPDTIVVRPFQPITVRTGGLASSACHRDAAVASSSSSSLTSVVAVAPETAASAPAASNCVRSRLLHYDVVPPRKTGPSEAERKIAILTQQIERDMRRLDATGSGGGGASRTSSYLSPALTSSSACPWTVDDCSDRQYRHQY